MSESRFRGTERYVATDDMMMAVNAAVTLGRPLLVKGEPGTGKTQLAEEVALALNRPFIQWHIKSTIKAQQGLYEYDAVSRLRDSQLGDARVHDIGNYIVKGKLWEAFTADVQPVLLIDEIDKADIEFPNDLLHELDRMEFFVYETRQVIKAPIGRSSSSPVITRRNCRMLSCAAAFSLHPLPRQGDDGADRQCALSEFEKAAAQRGAGSVFRDSRRAGLKEAAIHFGIAGLDQVAGGRRHPARGAARRPAQG
jgi:hypothetical protein